MFKKFLPLILFTVIVPVFAAEFQITEYIGPADTVANRTTIDSPGSSLQNCLTDLTVISSATYTINILSGTTTNYLALVPANLILNDDFMMEPWCAGFNESLAINVSTTSGNKVYINYKGYIRGIR